MKNCIQYLESQIAKYKEGIKALEPGKRESLAQIVFFQIYLRDYDYYLQQIKSHELNRKEFHDFLKRQLRTEPDNKAVIEACLGEFTVPEFTDQFLDDKVCIDRLFDEWKRYKSLIVAVDFDNTLFDYYKKGYTFNNVINLLRSCKELGFHITIFTSCNEDRFPEIKKYLADNNIPYDSINETPDYIPFKGRKVYYNILLDDRSGIFSAYNQLETVVYKIRSMKAMEGVTDVA